MNPYSEPLCPPPRGWFLPDRLRPHMDHACAIFLKSPWYKDPKNDAPSPWVCYGVVWYCMVRYGMVWVLTIDGCFLQMGASHPSVERGGHMPIVHQSRNLTYSFSPSRWVPSFGYIQSLQASFWSKVVFSRKIFSCPFLLFHPSDSLVTCRKLTKIIAQVISQARFGTV